LADIEKKARLKALTASIAFHILIIAIAFLFSFRVSEAKKNIKRNIIIKYEIGIDEGGGSSEGSGTSGISRNRLRKGEGISYSPKTSNTTSQSSRSTGKKTSIVRVQKESNNNQGVHLQKSEKARNNRDHNREDYLRTNDTLPSFEELMNSNTIDTSANHEKGGSQEPEVYNDTYSDTNRTTIGNKNNGSKALSNGGAGDDGVFGDGSKNGSGSAKGTGQGVGGGTGSDRNPCPENMVQIPFGDDYFCIDQFEYPNQYGAMPISGVSADRAMKLCSIQGKRLCRTHEWKLACVGIHEKAFPYGRKYDPLKCNTIQKRAFSSGSFPMCVSDFHVYDLSGNLAEWTIATGNQAHSLLGDSSNANGNGSCSSSIIKKDIFNSNEIGFRCCK